jgi:hypothetical protein
MVGNRSRLQGSVIPHIPLIYQVSLLSVYIKQAFFVDKRKSCLPAERGGENLSGLWTTSTFDKLLGIERFLHDQETAAEG